MYTLVEFDEEEFYKQQKGKLIIENDSPSVSDSYIIKQLSKEGIKCHEV